MKKSLIVFVKILIVFTLILLLNSAKGQDCKKNLKLFEPLMNKEWKATIGNLKIIWTIDYVLDSSAVKKTLKLPQKDLSSETLFYWDLQNNELAFLRLVNKGHVAKGKVYRENDLIVLDGILNKQNVESKFKNTLELVSDTLLIDKWFGKNGIEHNIKHVGKDIIENDEPIQFMPELVPDGMLIHRGIFSPDLQEYYYTISDQNFTQFNVKMISMKNGKWSRPEDAFFNTYYFEHGMSFSPDGKFMYFSSTRPITENKEHNTWQIWRSEKKGNEWTDPVHIEIPGLQNKLISHPTITKEGTLYFHSGNQDYSDLNIWYSKQINGKFQKAVKLPDVINFNKKAVTPFVDPDESYILFESLSIMYISYKNEKGNWTKAQALPEKINENGQGNPYVTPDKRYLFYVAGKEQVWKVYQASTKKLIINN